MLRKIRAIPKVKKVFIRSGIRYDYLIEDKDDEFMRELIENHVSGQLKVAPEHCSAAVLDKMGKPHIEAYKKFQDKFYRMTNQIGKEQYLVPYLMSSHPGSTLNDAVELALFLKSLKMRPEQVQDFYPTPGTLSTCMFYTELDPYTLEKVYVPKTAEEKGMQRALLQYFRPQNQRKCIEALQRAHRTDLIGSTPDCLVKPDAQYLRELNERRQKQAEKGRGHGTSHGKANGNSRGNTRGRNDAKANGRNGSEKNWQQGKNHRQDQDHQAHQQRGGKPNRGKNRV